MLQSVKNELAKLRHSVLVTGLKMMAVTVLLLCSVVSQASAQGSSMGYGVNYDDAWLIGYNQYYTTTADGGVAITHENEPMIYVNGCGIYEESYNSYGHQYSVRTKITAPNGSSVTNQSSYGGGYSSIHVRSDAAIRFFPDLPGNIGNFLSQHDTTGYCPSSSYYNAYYGAGGGFLYLPVGVSFSCYRLDSGDPNNPLTGTYKVIPNCNATCKSPSYTYTYTPREGFRFFLRVAEPYVVLPTGRKQCNRIIGLPLPTDFCNDCSDVDI